MSLLVKIEITAKNINVKFIHYYDISDDLLVLRFALIDILLTKFNKSNLKIKQTISLSRNQYVPLNMKLNAQTTNIYQCLVFVVASNIMS